MSRAGRSTSVARADGYTSAGHFIDPTADKISEKYVIFILFFSGKSHLYSCSWY